MACPEKSDKKLKSPALRKRQNLKIIVKATVAKTDEIQNKKMPLY
jgi:hypothetical protein